MGAKVGKPMQRLLLQNCEVVWASASFKQGARNQLLFHFLLQPRSRFVDLPQFN
jgi:hypothetical protein